MTECVVLETFAGLFSGVLLVAHDGDPLAAHSNRRNVVVEERSGYGDCTHPKVEFQEVGFSTLDPDDLVVDSVDADSHGFPRCCW